MSRKRSDSGIALVVVLLTMGLLSATALGLVLSSTVTRLTGANYDESLALANASESALELAARELGLIADWDDVLRGAQVSTLVDGAPGLRTVAPGVSIDLVKQTHQLTCGSHAPCADAEVRVATWERPWAANNPRWRLFIHQPLPLVPIPSMSPPIYIVVWLGDDGAETDGDPQADGAGIGQEGRYIVRARAEAFGPRGGRHALEAELVRICDPDGQEDACRPGIRVQSWRAVGNSLP